MDFDRTVFLNLSSVLMNWPHFYKEQFLNLYMKYVSLLEILELDLNLYMICRLVQYGVQT